MKKSLVILSISLILLVSLSFVSAESFGMRQTSLNYNGFPGLELSWFGNLFGGKATGSAIQTVEKSLKVGESAVYGDVVVKVTNINSVDKIVDLKATGGPSGEKTFSLNVGKNFIYDTVQITLSDLIPAGFFNFFTATAKIKIVSASISNELPPGNGDEETPQDLSSCETLVIEELYISPGNVGEEVLNNRFIDFSRDEVLTIDETFSTQLEEGNEYYVPIPNQKCYWKASYKSGELYMITECYVDEE